MRLLVPAASAALIVGLALSAGAAAPAADRRSVHVGSAQDGSVPVASVPVASVQTGSMSAATGGVGSETAAGRAGGVAPGGGFTWPLSPRPVVVRRFVRPSSQWSPGHRGVDLRATTGQPVLGAGQGVVAFSGVIAGRGVITVRHPGGLRTTYEPVDQRLASGTVVQRGARIGVLSPTAGHCVPLTCLHWGAIFGQVYRDPLSLLGLGRPILLPLR